MADKKELRDALERVSEELLEIAVEHESLKQRSMKLAVDVEGIKRSLRAHGVEPKPAPEPEQDVDREPVPEPASHGTAKGAKPRPRGRAPWEEMSGVIMEHVHENGATGPSNLSQYLAGKGFKRAENACSAYLARLTREGKLERVKPGWYKLKLKAVDEK